MSSSPHINASKSSTHNHAIKVAGVLCANRKNEKGITRIFGETEI